MTLKECLYLTIHRNKKPLKLIAEEIGMSENYLTRAALPDLEESETGSGCRFPLKKLIPLIRATGDYAILDHIEHSLGRVAIVVPAPTGVQKDIYRFAMQAVKEFGELMGELDRDVADGRLTRDEISRIQKEGHEALQAIVNLMHNLKSSKG